MPFTKNNNRYEPDKPYKRRMRSLISRYLKTETGLCKRSEFVQILNELRSIETDFFQQFGSSNINQDMENFAIQRILTILNKLYKARYQSTYLLTDEPLKVKRNIAKKIWKERCKERERCPRGGVIIIVNGEVVLVRYKTGNCTNYGHSKGKIEFKETIQKCVAREIQEELGLSFNSVYKLIQNKTPIKKDVRYNFDGLSHIVEHYYFIIVLSPTEYRNLRPNKYEIHDVELRSIDTLPCCQNCLLNPLVESDDELEEEHSNYYMVSCTNFTVATSLVRDIINFVDKENGNQVELDKHNEKHRFCQRKIGTS